MPYFVYLATMTAVTFQQIQEAYPDTSFPNPDLLTNAGLAQYGYGIYTIDPEPTTPFYVYTLGPIVADADGTYSQGWVSTPMTVEQAQNYLVSQIVNHYNVLQTVPMSFNGCFIQLSLNTVVSIRESINALAKAYITDMNGNYMELNQQAAEYVADTMAAILSTLNQAQYKHMMDISNITSIADAQNYNPMAGWGTLFTVNGTQIFANVQPNQF
jgi:hypothetical protein